MRGPWLLPPTPRTTEARPATEAAATTEAAPATEAAATTEAAPAFGLTDLRRHRRQGLLEPQSSRSSLSS